MVNQQMGIEEKVLTISVAAYNAEAWLARCLKSLVETDVAADLDVIVVNDGSTDGTLIVAKEFESNYPDTIRIIDKENGGHGSTINAAIEKARGKYFKIVDSDDWVERDGIEHLVDALRNVDCDLVLNPFYTINAVSGEKTLSNDCFETNANTTGIPMDINDVKGKLSFVMHFITYRTSVLQISPYRLDEHCFYVDNEYIVYYLSSCKSIMLLDCPVYDYLLGTSEQSMNFSNMLRRRSQHEKVCMSCVRFYAKHPNLSGIRRKAVQSCTLRMVAGTYRILLCLPYTMSEREIVAFDQAILAESPELYRVFLKEYADGSVSKIVRWLRKRNFSHYRMINAFYRIKYRCTNETVSTLSE